MVSWRAASGRVEHRHDVALGEQVPLGQHDHVGPVGQRRGILPDLAPQLVVDRLRVLGVERHQEREHAGALDVLQELEAEPLPLVRPLDDAGDVRQDERTGAGELHHAEVRFEGGEGIVGDLRDGRR